MLKEKCIEIIAFEVLEKYDEVTILEGFKILDDYYMKVEGYCGMYITEGDSKKYTLVLKWSSIEHARIASSSMMKSDETNGFKKLIIPSTVVKNLNKQIILK